MGINLRVIVDHGVVRGVYADVPTEQVLKVEVVDLDNDSSLDTAERAEFVARNWHEVEGVE